MKAVGIGLLVLLLGGTPAASAAPSAGGPLVPGVHLGQPEDRVDDLAAGASGPFGPRRFVTPNNLGTTAWPFQATNPNISGDGSVIVYTTDVTVLSPDTPGYDVFYEIGGRQYRPYDESLMTAGGGSYGAACPNISRDGRIIVFCSDSPALVRGDHNKTVDLFAYDRDTGTTQRINVATDGTESAGRYYNEMNDAAISADGRYVAFTSADALVPQDVNHAPDVYVRDLVAHTTTLASVSSAGRPGNYLSGWDSGRLGMSGDGRYVTFTSYATNLVPGDTNHTEDVFLHDMTTSTTERITVADDGSQLTRNPRMRAGTGSRNSSVSDDGRYVAFDNDGLGLDGLTTQPGQDVYLRDRTAHTTRLISRNERGTPCGDELFHGCAADRLSPDGRYLMFSSDSRRLNQPVRGNGFSALDRTYYEFIYVIATGQLIRFPDYSARAAMTTNADRVVYQKVRYRTPAQAIATRTLHPPR